MAARILASVAGSRRYRPVRQCEISSPPRQAQQLLSLSILQLTAARRSPGDRSKGCLKVVGQLSRQSSRHSRASSTVGRQRRAIPDRLPKDLQPRCRARHKSAQCRAAAASDRRRPAPDRWLVALAVALPASAAPPRFRLSRNIIAARLPSGVVLTFALIHQAAEEIDRCACVHA